MQAPPPNKEPTMNRNLQCKVLARAATALLLAFSAGAQAEGLSREQVRAELAEARAQGLLDRPGEIGASANVLLAREQYNETQTRVLIARQELESEPAAGPVVYLEAGRLGPVFVKVSTAPDGSIRVIDGPLPAGAVAIWAAVDYD
jgi:hypothetical protein